MRSQMALVGSGCMLAPFLLVPVPRGVMPVSHDFFRKKYCHPGVANCLGGASPMVPGHPESGTFGGVGTLEDDFRLGTRSDLYFNIARGNNCVLDH